jgi:ABC-2 type transport system permease protein
VTASIDDAAELSRFSLFPVTPKRLFLASVLAGLVEPRTLPIWGALLGAASGLHEAAHVRWTVALPATIALALCSVVWGRVGLHLLLNVLRSRRSAETLGGGLLVMLFGAAFVPPPDLSWLRDFDATAPQVDDALLQGSIDLFTLLPTGGWGTALFFDAARLRGWIPVALLYLALAIVVGYVLAYWLLARFHRRAGRALPQRIDEEKRRQTYQHQSLARVLVERELRDLWLNPRTRMTLALPFFLAILLKLVGARALAMEFIGPLTDA